jgi:phosphatidylserine/phosphatidylglycerophosphate/cardiolipin synthase-like enzyme
LGKHHGSHFLQETSAEERIRITTPYFIPNEAILIALKVPLDLV